MARNYWQGGTGATRSSWNQANNWSTGSIPADGEDVVIPASTRVPLLTDGDRTGDTAADGLDLASFTVERGYPGQLGQRNEPLQFAVSSGVVLHQGDETLYFTANSGNANDDTDNIIIDSPNAELAAVLHVPDTIAVFSVQCLSGHTEISTEYAGAADGEITNLSIGQRSAASEEPTVQTSGDSFIATIIVSGGNSVLGHTETERAYVAGGTVAVMKEDFGFSGQQIRVFQTGGRIDWFGGLGTGFPLAEMHVLDGVLNLNASSTDKLIDTLVIHPDATVLHNRKWVTVTAYRDFGLDLFRSPDIGGTINTYLDVDDDWENINNWSEGSIPVNGEQVVIPGTATNSLTTNMDQTGLGTGLRLASLTIHDDYVGDVGTSGTPLKCTISGRLIHRGRGTLYFTAEEGSASTTTTEVIIDSPNSNDAAVIVVPDSNAIKWLEVLRGRVTLTTGSASGTVTDTHIAGTAHVTVAADSLTNRVVVSGGQIDNSAAAMERALCSGGRFRILADDVDWQPASFLYLFVANRGLLELEGGIAAAAQTTHVHAMGGTINFNRTAATKVIEALFQHPRAKVKANRAWAVFDDVYDFALAPRSGS